MKASYAGLALVGLLLGGLWYVGGGTTPLPPSAAAAEQVRVSEPVAHENLTVYFVHGSDAVECTKVATLQEALAAGWAVVHETGDVNELAVENRSTEYELFIQEGDIIKGGKQDRMIAIDMLLPPKSGRVPFPAHCVEQGRWTGRGNETVVTFHSSSNFAVGNNLKYANATYQQGEVWKNVALQQDKLSANVGTRINAAESASSLQLALENPAVKAKVSDYENALRAACENRANVVGVVFVVNGKMTGAEVYGSSALFQKAWPKLLNAAATEALAEKSARSQATAPTAKEVERYLACGGDPQPTPGANGEGREIRDGTTNGVARNRGRGSNPTFENTLHFNPSDPARQDPQQANPEFNRDSFSGRSAATRNVLIQNGGGLVNLPPNANPAEQDVRQQVAELETAYSARVSRQLPANAAKPTGNRLNVNRVDGASGLVTESRDPARQNAIIHKSYIKK